MKNFAPLAAALTATALVSSWVAPAALARPAAEAPPAWSQCPQQLMLNGKSHKLQAEFYVNRMPQVVSDGQPPTPPRLNGTLSLDPPAPAGATLDHVWLTREALSWDGPLHPAAGASRHPGGAELRGGPGWKDGPINVRARIRIGTNTTYLRTSTTLTSAW